MTCRFYIVMSYCGKNLKLSEKMCHYNWKHCEDVRDAECKYIAKRTTEN